MIAWMIHKEMMYIVHGIAITQSIEGMKRGKKNIDRHNNDNIDENKDKEQRRNVLNALSKERRTCTP